MTTERPERRVDPMVVAGVISIAAVTAIVALGWWTQRRGLNLFIDEAGYVSFAVDHRAALRHDGIGGWLSSGRAQTGAAPLVPMLASLAIAVLGHPVGATTLVTVAFVPVLAGSTYALARSRLAPGPAAAAAALCVCAGEVVSLAGSVYFAVPAAALTTLSAALFVRSDHGRAPGWAIGGGVVLGLAFLTRSMCIAFGPAVLVLALPTRTVLRGRDGRRGLAVLAASAAIALLVGGWWLSAHLSEQVDHLGVDSASQPDIGRGQGAGSGGLRLPLVVDTRQLASSVGAPLAAAGVVAVASSFRRRRPSADPAPTPEVAVTSRRLLAYLALLALPLVVAPDALGQWLVVMAPGATFVVEALARHRPRARAVLGGAVAASAVWSVVASSGIVPAAAGNRTVVVPVLGRVRISDGETLLTQHTRGDEACSPSVTSEEWFAISLDVASRSRALADAAEVVPVLFAEQLASQYVNVNTIRLADRLLPGDPEVLTGVLRFQDGLEQDDLEARLEDPAFGLPNLVFVGPRPPGAQADHRAALRAIEAVGFQPVVSYETPCGAEVGLWSRIAPPDPAPVPP